MLNDIFRGRKKADPLKRTADHLDGAYSILTGIAANRSFETGMPVHVDDLLHLGKPTHNSANGKSPMNSRRNGEAKKDTTHKQTTEKRRVVHA